MATVERIKQEQLTGVVQPRPHAATKSTPAPAKKVLTPEEARTSFTYKATRPLSQESLAASTSSVKHETLYASTTHALKPIPPIGGAAPSSTLNGTTTPTTAPANKSNSHAASLAAASSNRTNTAAGAAATNSLVNRPTSAPSSTASSSQSSLSLTVAPSPVTSAAFLNKFAAPVSSLTGDGLVPQLGRGWSGVGLAARPAPLNAGERAKLAQRAQQEATVESLRQAGLIGGKSNANSSETIKRLALARPANVGSVRVNGVNVPITGIKRKATEEEPIKTNYSMVRGA